MGSDAWNSDALLRGRCRRTDLSQLLVVSSLESVLIPIPDLDLRRMSRMVVVVVEEEEEEDEIEEK
jgi:hypothetical protein